ncbi:LacI family DNA-binding transcriptional regulator [Cryobacterium sp. Y11]|uniref:LacI family DNA-binding transcriptional regulator n=1 Tax=Cryobacterium sp. Y11 TaxID=2045016 RepID=UPI001E3B7DA6|nr:LacI family DNA-binding transcriptional regulator [Cryobacterium sp. Y11]
MAIPGTAPETPGYFPRTTASMVASRAGVSVATVSLVASGKTDGRVSAETVIRVQRAITDLHYVVNRVASSLATGSSNFVILVAPDISNSFFARLIAGVREALGSSYQLLLSVTDSGQMPRAESVRELLAFRPAGLLVDAPSAQLMQSMTIDGPIVLLDAPGAHGIVPAVNLDVVHGAESLATHLAERGHHTFAYFDSVTGTSTFALRRTAFVAKAEECGMRQPETAHGKSTIDTGSAAAEFAKVWPAWQAAGVTAVVCATDTHAYGVLQIAHSLGIRVPEQLAVAGFDDLPFSSMSHPSLTSVELPARKLGRAAASLLVALIEGRAPDSAPPILPSRLIIRDSTGGQN